MILNTDTPEVFHDGNPIQRIDMNDMDAESIRVMIENSRDGFYSNKELAPIREYSTNARDSHIQSGIPTRPIEITLPTQMEPELKIRDFGVGLSMMQMTDVYFKYWKSTKRNSNDVNGCLGIGAKSAFAYAPMYTVTSWCDGMKTVATGQKNGFADIIFNQPNIENEEQGVEIVIPIQTKDIEKFINEALQFFKYWDIRPIFHNIDPERLKGVFSFVDVKPFIFGDGWEVRPAGHGKGETKAVMGFVPYDIDWKQVRNSLSAEVFQKISGIFDFLQENITTLTFDNGSLAFTPNRETLQYNELTVNELSKKLQSICTSLTNLITEKISDAPNLWEAKIRYNQLFRHDLDGFDKSLQYGGNLSTIEHLLKNRIQWNGIIISNGYFDDMDGWNDEGDGFKVFKKYVKNIERTNVKLIGQSRRRWESDNSRIVCSPKSVVIVQDIDNDNLAKNFARWVFYKSGQDVSQVYVLNLSNPVTREEFYKENNFATVPVKILSENESLVKSYLKSIRAPRGTRVAGESVSRPLNCPFVEIKNRRLGGYLSSGMSWECEDVNARNLDSGGYYVVYSRNGFILNGKEYTHDSSGNFWQSIYDLALLAGVNIPKVYGIHAKIADSVWFKEAIEEGDWTNLSEFVNENSDCLPIEVIKKTLTYIDNDENRIGTYTAEKLLPLLVDADGLIANYFKLLVEFRKHWNIRHITSYLGLASISTEETYVESFKKLQGDIKNKYPLLFKMNNGDTIKNCDESTNKYKFLDDAAAKELANYINLVDCYS